MISFLFIFSTTENFILAETTVISRIEYKSTDKILQTFQEQIQQNNSIIYSKVPRGLVLSIDSSLFFDNDSTKLKTNSFFILNKIGNILKIIDKPCVIEGNTVLKNSQSKNYANWEISTIRAQEIANYLIKTFKLSPNKIQSIGFGEMMPFGDNVQYGGNLNDRIDFVIINYDEAKR